MGRYHVVMEPSGPSMEPSPQPPSIHGDDMLRQYLATHEAQCPQCQYLLQYLTGDRCPECGEQLTLQIGRKRQQMGSWLTMVVLTSMGCYAFGDYSFWILQDWIFYGVLNDPLAQMTQVAGCLAMFTHVPLLLATILLRRTFLTWPVPLRRGAAVVVAVWFVITVVFNWYMWDFFTFY